LLWQIRKIKKNAAAFWEGFQNCPDWEALTKSRRVPLRQDREGLRSKAARVPLAPPNKAAAVLVVVRQDEGNHPNNSQVVAVA
jgi:hypothetical protein